MEIITKIYEIADAMAKEEGPTTSLLTQGKGFCQITNAINK